MTHERAIIERMGISEAKKLYRKLDKLVQNLIKFNAPKAEIDAAIGARNRWYNEISHIEYVRECGPGSGWDFVGGAMSREQ